MVNLQFLSCFNNVRTKKILLVASVFFILLIVWSALAWILANNLVIEKPLLKADAILVLGGAASYLERTDEAAAIFKEGTAPKIFLTNDGVQGGWNQKEQRNPYFVERAHDELIQQGVPADAIEILPGLVNGTNDEAKLLVEVSAQKKLKSVLLVTSAYHTRRALWTFERVLSRHNSAVIVGIKSSPNGQLMLSPFNWWLSRQGWQTVGEEYVKLAYYWLFY